MDPNATLAELRSILSDYLSEVDNDPEQVDMDEGTAVRVVDLFQALDGWLSAGGFLPQAWGKGR